MKRYAFFIGAFCSMLSGFGAHAQKIQREVFSSFEPYVVRGRGTSFTLNYGRMKHLYLDERPCISWGPFVGSGARLSNSGWAMENKVGYLYNRILFGGRIQGIHYSDFKRNAFAIRPEAGIAFCNAFIINYGYNFVLARENVFQAKGHMLSLGLFITSYWFVDQNKPSKTK
jgi:hypothetical protein